MLGVAVGDALDADNFQHACSGGRAELRMASTSFTAALVSGVFVCLLVDPAASRYTLDSPPLPPGPSRGYRDGCAGTCSPEARRRIPLPDNQRLWPVRQQPQAAYVTKFSPRWNPLVGLLGNGIGTFSP